MFSQRNPLRKVIAGVLVSAVALATITPSAWAGTAAGKKARYLPEVSPEVEAEVLEQVEFSDPSPTEIVILDAAGQLLYQEILAEGDDPTAEAHRWMNKSDLLFSDYSTKYYCLSE